MKQYQYYLGAMCFTVATSCSGGSIQQNGQDKIKTVKIETVKPASSRSILQFPGKVKATHDINVSFRVGGTIENVFVKEGEQIHKGQLLAQLDPTDYEIQLCATEAEYKQIKGESERVMALYKENGTTPNANDKAVYGLQQIEAKYNSHKNQLSYTRLYAPFNGYVQKRLFDVNETVAAGMPVISLISSDMPEVELSLPASDYVHRNEFKNYTCTFDVYPEKVYDLRQISITEKANANQLYTMRLKLENGMHPIPSPGMNCMVTIDCNSSKHSEWIVPCGALFQDGGKEYLYVYTQGRIHRVLVQTIRPKSDGTVFVHCEALKVGDNVVSSGTSFLKEGEDVKILFPVSTTNEGGLL